MNNGFQRLADIAHTLLKVSPYDPESMGCRGLQHYMSYILPSTEWANDAMRPALVTILRRLDKVFQKIQKKPSIRVCTINRNTFSFRIYVIHYFYRETLIGMLQLVS